MARKRDPKSNNPFSGLGLKPEEDKKLTELLEQKDLSYKQVVRALIRQWMAEGGEGVLKYSKK